MTTSGYNVRHILSTNFLNKKFSYSSNVLVACSNGVLSTATSVLNTPFVRNETTLHLPRVAGVVFALS